MKTRLLLLAALATPAWAAQPLPVIDVYKSPSCSCCGKWIDHLMANGFAVRAHNTDDVVSHKYRLGVPPGHGSCHTAEMAGYVVEGHVPAREIKRLLKEKPQARGLVVPAMPIGSPGMEHGAMAAMSSTLTEGVVKKVDPAQGKLTISHGPLEHLGMPAMTMIFRVQEPALLERVKSGDQIRFLADKVNGRLTVTRIEPAR